MKTEIKPYEKQYQVGNIIEIINEPENGRQLGLRIGSKHQIVKPPKNHLNCGRHIWIFDKFGKHFCLSFYCYKWLGKSLKLQKHHKKLKEYGLNSHIF